MGPIVARREPGQVPGFAACASFRMTTVNQQMGCQEARPPGADPLLGCGTAPDPVRLAGSHREVQALLPYLAAGADPPRLGDLPAGEATGRRDGEEQVKVGGQARACRAPVGGVLDHLASLPEA